MALARFTAHGPQFVDLNFGFMGSVAAANNLEQALFSSRCQMYAPYDHNSHFDNRHHGLWQVFVSKKILKIWVSEVFWTSRLPVV